MERGSHNNTPGVICDSTWLKIDFILGKSSSGKGTSKLYLFGIHRIQATCAYGWPGAHASYLVWAWKVSPAC